MNNNDHKKTGCPFVAHPVPVFYLVDSFNSKYKKYGAPIIATTVPAGISPLPGDKRPIVSLINNKTLPIAVATGKSCQCFFKTQATSNMGSN